MGKNCRVCGSHFFEDALLIQKKMPKSAQNFPNADDLQDDAGIDIEVFQCFACGLVQLTNEVVPYYKEVIRATEISDEVKAFRRQHFEKIFDSYKLRGKKVIEIGCGRGGFLSVINDFDVDAYGIEYADDAVEFCQKNGLKVSKGFIENSTDNIIGAPFDFLMILNFLEHLPDPNSTLRGIHNNLSTNGIVHIEVPNFDMIVNENLFSEFIPDHIFYFTKESLTLLLNRNGFEVIEFSEERDKYVLSVLAKKRLPVDLTRFIEYQNRIKTDIYGFLDQFDTGEVAIWGAGHQSLAIISLLNLKGRIKFVVDSAEFKQNRFTPASHIRITSPDTLYSEPVDAIIVMAAAYSDEVAGIVKKNHKNVKLAILRSDGLEVL